MARPSTILLDFGGTLDCPSHWLDRFLRHYRAAGVEIEREELNPAFDHATRTGYAAGQPIQRFGLGDLVRFLVGNQFEYLRRGGPAPLRARLEIMTPRERLSLAEKIRGSFLGETVKGLAHSREILGCLRGQYRLGVVSNWYGNLDVVIEEAGMARLVDAVIDSARVGRFKPDPAIFMTALKDLHVPAAEAVMVGDSLEKDCVPARRVGMRTVLLRVPGPAAAGANSRACHIPDYIIGSLDELVEFRW